MHGTSQVKVALSPSLTVRLRGVILMNVLVLVAGGGKRGCRSLALS